MFLTSPQTKGRLLLATPPLEDPDFDRSVVYVLEHHEEGAIGLVLNRPSDEALEAPLDRWIDLQAVPSSVFTGGPVDTNAMIGMATTKVVAHEPVEHITPISGLIASTDLSADPAIVAAHVDSVRVFRGYAGWGAGQLDMEIDQGAWLVLDAEVGDVFSDRPEDLWRTILKRQPGRLSWLALAPDDLSLN
ncbi:MAG: YqgE/AlgH family protein [Ilumatobacter sp.]|uniref:YqgE/AlgH family protein n=1 Tax=Ilumatobacter sp. TaxID=1967498 RepID=UPI00329A1E53